MDLIEDVSRASQNLTNELINTNTGFHDMTGFNIIHTEEEANVQHIIMLTQPEVEQLADPIIFMPSNIPKNTTVGFHRGSGLQQELEPLLEELQPT